MTVKPIIFLLFAFAYSNGINAENDTIRIAKDVYSFSPNGNDTDTLYSMFVVLCDTVIAIEPYTLKHAELFIAAIRRVTNNKITHLLISHNHWDHATGAKAFKDIDAKVIIHREAIPWQRANPYPDLWVVTNKKDMWYGNYTEIKEESEECKSKVELHYKGMNHGLGMTFFRAVIQDDVENPSMFIADLVYANATMFGPVLDFNLVETERTLKELLTLKFNATVFSHSARSNPNEGGSKADVQMMYDYLVDIRKGIDEELGKGENIYAISSILTLTKYAGWVRYDTGLAANINKRIYERVMGPYPWRIVDDGRDIDEEDINKYSNASMLTVSIINVFFLCLVALLMH